MKVVEQGDGRTGWAKEFKCTGTGNGNGNGGCGAILLVEGRDLYHTYHHDYGGGKDTYTTFTCPQCGNETDVTGVPSSANVRGSKSSNRDSGWK